MAHSCPECNQACYCNGDIDDILFGEDSEEALLCTHCPVDGVNEFDYEDDHCSECGAHVMQGDSHDSECPFASAAPRPQESA
jgi:hypothetical protein